MSFYRHRVFPYLLDLAMASPALREPRRRTLAPAQGRILEIGFGTGRNLAHYPASVTRIEAIDPDRDLDRVSLPRIRRARIAVDFHHLDAEHLPFAAESFDTVVSTMTLCSIPDAVHALGEIRRVLKPGGRFLFLEHGKAPDPGVARFQDRVNSRWGVLAGGCRLNRPVVQLVTDSGLLPGPIASYYMRRTPRFVGYMTEGVAQKA
ncbi:MAG: class I SAM-dependent methyltransferase [Steroidobacteraceae bacterium]|nr:class I SAM-dependent methyltransferase [Steroidobacteraceae bacterium]